MMPEIQSLMTAGRSRLSAENARMLLADPATREVLDRVARLASLALRAPVAIVGVVDHERLRIASEVGLPEPWRGARHLPLGATFCRHVALSGEPFVVDDAARHAVG